MSNWAILWMVYALILAWFGGWAFAERRTRSDGLGWFWTIGFASWSVICAIGSYLLFSK